MPDDIVRDVIRRVREVSPRMSVHDLRALEMQLRAEFGGRRYYIRKAPTATCATNASAAHARDAIGERDIRRVA